MSNIRRKIVILSLLVLFIVGFFVLFFRFIFPNKIDPREGLDLCGLFSENGEVYLVSQGTVASFSGIRIGLLSIRDHRANIKIWTPDNSVKSPTLTLGSCENTNFEGRDIYVVSVKEKFKNPWAGPGSSQGYISILVKNAN